MTRGNPLWYIHCEDYALRKGSALEARLFSSFLSWFTSWISIFPLFLRAFTERLGRVFSAK